MGKRHNWLVANAISWKATEEDECNRANHRNNWATSPIQAWLLLVFVSALWSDRHSAESDEQLELRLAVANH
jgi:hypothetical protein